MSANVSLNLSNELKKLVKMRGHAKHLIALNLLQFSQASYLTEFTKKKTESWRKPSNKLKLQLRQATNLTEALVKLKVGIAPYLTETKVKTEGWIKPST